MQSDNIMIGMLLTLLAGLSTGIGSAISFFYKRTNTKVLSGALGLSAGVMIYVSFVELMPTGCDLLEQVYDKKMAELYTIIAFFLGIIIIALIDFLVPEDENPHEVHTREDLKKMEALKRTGMMTAVAISIHNFPEGMATFATALSDISLAVPIMIAIAIHNIPEGMAVSVPIYHATGNKKRAFWLSFLSGMAEPVGAVIGFFFLLPFWSPELNAALLSLVSGIMVYISFDELLPATESFGHHHIGIIGVILGMFLMAATLWVGV